jgi:hypothetical protein
MTQQAVGYEDSDIPLQSGRLRVRRWGAADAPAVVCVPGLSANLALTAWPSGWPATCCSWWRSTCAAAAAAR